MVKSTAYPDLERKPGGPDNWVERAGGLPKYIERIAKHLHYERGFSISRAIASAVNTVKRWARMGKVAKYGDPNHKHVNAKTALLAAKAVAEWNAKRVAGKINLTAAEFALIDLCDVSEEFALELAEEMQNGTIDLAEELCAVCGATATKKVIWADGRAYQPSCDAHVKEVQDMLKKKNGKMTELAGVQDLSDASVDKTSTMVALMLPEDAAKKTSIEGGVPPEDRHVTITFHGDTTDEQHVKMVEALQAYAKDWQSGPLKGTMGGLGQFPAGEDGVPHYVPVDLPGLNTLHEQVKAVTDKIAPASELHGYTPHSTLTYTKDGEEPPAPVPPHPVEFDSIHVVRGNKQRTRIPLGAGASADLTECGTLDDINIDLARGDVDIQSLADRANKIQDPAARASARAAVLDLASTIPPKNARGRASDGRKSFRGQGKWKHGFIPVTEAASDAKAKGSPIAKKRLKRIFGKPGQDSEGARNQVPARSHPNRPIVKGKATSRVNEPGGKVHVDEKNHPGAETANSVGQLRTSAFDPRHAPKDTKGTTHLDSAPKSNPRATQDWDSIPDNLKTVRNGKKYVLANFNGRGYLTEWVGGVNTVDSTSLDKRKVMRTLAPADAAQMSPQALRDLVNNPQVADAVKKVARRALVAMAKEKNNG